MLAQFKGLPATLKEGKDTVSVLDVPLSVPLWQQSEGKTRGVLCRTLKTVLHKLLQAPGTDEPKAAAAG